MSEEYIIKPEWVFEMDENFICPKQVWYDGEFRDIISYGLFSEWAFSDYKKCVTFIKGDDFCMGGKTDKFPDSTYAIFTKYMVFVPCVGCGSFTVFNFQDELQKVVK